MRFEGMKQRIRALPEVAAWPQMLEVIERAVHRELHSVWEYPVVACQAVGGTVEAALPGAAAIFCSLASVHLVDDMLDDDPAGDYRRIGAGRAANLALAFQAAGHRLLDVAAIKPKVRALLQASLAEMALATAFGQDMDAREATSEDEYWRVTDAKTPPLFAASLAIGALLGGAPVGTAAQLGGLGRILGRFIQVSDDLTDAMEAPARPDWSRPGNNLPILFARTAEHAEREEFRRLCTRSAEPEALAAAQAILVRSGAVGYCAFRMVDLSRQANDLLARLPLHDPEPMEQLLSSLLRPLHALFESIGVEEPALLAIDR